MKSIRTVLFAAAIAAIAGSPSASFAQLQSKHQIKCLNELNKSAALVSQAQGDDNHACVKAAGREELSMTAQECLTADLKGKVGKRLQRTAVMGDLKCATEQPTFGATDADTVNAAASGAQIDLVSDLFGADLETTLIGCDDDADACKCQAKVMQTAARLAATTVKEFAGCAKRAIQVNKQPFLSGAVSAADLEACLIDPGTPWSVAADERGKVAAAAAKLDSALAACPIRALFPGACAATDEAELGACLRDQADCRACLAINTMFALDADCAACEAIPPPPTE